MSSLTDEIMADIAAGGRLAEATAQGLREDRAKAEAQARQHGLQLCCCASARAPGCFNDAEYGALLCAGCRERGCEANHPPKPKPSKPHRPSMKDDLLMAANILEAFAESTLSGRPDVVAVALRLREAASRAGR